MGKNRLFVLFRIAVVLYSVMVVALPAIATASEGQERVLRIYGNANEDDTIDMRDFTFTSRIILGLEDATTFADAKYDGVVNVGDMAQIGLIIIEVPDELTFVDANGDAVTVSKPIERIVVHNTDAAESVRLLGAADKVVGVAVSVIRDDVFFPVLANKESTGGWREPCIETILDIDACAIIVYGRWPKPEALEDKLVGTDVDVIRLDLFRGDKVADEIKVLGYILDRREEAAEYIEFHDSIVDLISETLAGIPADDRETVFTGSGERAGGWRASGEGTGIHALSVMAGGKNILDDEGITGWADVTFEWILSEDPDKIMLWSAGGGYGGDYTKMKERFDAFRAVPGFHMLTAVVNEDVRIFVGDPATSPAFFVTLAYIAEWFYPDDFDLCHQTIHQEYLDRFHPVLDFCVRTEGAFSYP